MDESKSLLKSFSRALVIAPHTDDEFACAGTVIRLAEQGCDIRYIALSRCEESVPDGFAKNILEIECRDCTKSLGIDPNKVDIFDFPVRHFPNMRQEILEKFVEYRKEFKPELVLLPSTYDQHQDHGTVSTEGFRAFKHSSLLGYEQPQNFTSFTNGAFVGLSQNHMNKKIKALSHYKSQSIRTYFTEEFLRGLAIVRGAQSNQNYAEAFEIIRLIIP